MVFFKDKDLCFGLQSWVGSLTNLGTKDGLFKDKYLCFGYKSRTEGLTHLGTKDGSIKDKDLCFGYKSWRKACRNWARKMVLLRTMICALFTSRENKSHRIGARKVVL